MSARNDAYLNMTNDDLRAARVLTLALRFFSSRQPVSSTSINADLYPELDDSSFKRQFLRDRNLLASMGVVVRMTGDDGMNTYWEVDESVSYVQGPGLSETDARMLYVLCYDMAFDPSFPFRGELRMALAKISQMYRGSIVTCTDTTPASQQKVLAVLVSCTTSHHGVSVTYTDARGNTSMRTLAILGTFGLREHTYFVASRVQPDGSLEPDSIRTYRLDRFEKARELPDISYEIPQDFSVSDYERLPFQIGEPCGEARFDVRESRSHEVGRAMAKSGEVEDGIWRVSYSSVRAAAAWAVGHALMPVGPDELIEDWHQVLAKAAASHPFDASLAMPPSAQHATNMHKRRGRTGSVTVTRQLFALATSLTREGRVITAQDISHTLGIDYERARHLIALVSLGSGESIDYLPVILSDKDDEVSLMEGAFYRGRRVRLTRAETEAIIQALMVLDVDEDDPLMQTLLDSYAATDVTARDFARHLQAPRSSTDLDTIKQCSQAITNGQALSFSYRPVTGGYSSQRTVFPQMIRRDDDNWYLDAYDLVRQAPRVFRIDRISELQSAPEQPAPPAKMHDEPEHLVTIRFNDPLYLDVFHWNDLQVLTRDDTGTIASLPAYGGMWLARHLAACAGTVQVSDEHLAEQIVTYARETLASSAKS